MIGEHSGKFSVFVLVLSVTVAILWMPDFPRVDSMKTSDAEVSVIGSGRRPKLQKPGEDRQTDKIDERYGNKCLICVYSSITSIINLV